LIINTDGSFNFAPANGYSGPVPTATYTISDSNGGFDTSTLSFANVQPSANGIDNIGALIMLANPTQPLFPATSGPTYALLPFREPSPDGGLLHPSQFSWYSLLQDYDIYLTGQINDQVMLETKSNTFTVPYGTFRHSNPTEKLEYLAKQIDGSPLPNKVKFSGKPPIGTENLEVIVTAKDRFGHKASATFKISVKQDDEAREQKYNKVNISLNQGINVQGPFLAGLGEKHQVVASKAGFSEQITKAGKFGRLMESRALLDSIRQL
jgi:hypothetical protein